MVGQWREGGWMMVNEQHQIRYLEKKERKRKKKGKH